jgi:hypothetical protein
MDKKTQQIVGAGAAVLVLIAGFMLVNKKPATKVLTDAAGTSTEQAAVVDSAAVANAQDSYTTGLPDAKNIKANAVEGLTVADQAAGDTVAVNNLNVGAMTWVVVYEADEAGQPGRILGAGLAWPGNETFVVSLMRKTDLAKTYFVSLISDDGSKKFDLRKLRPTDNTAVVSFKTI